MAAFISLFQFLSSILRLLSHSLLWIAMYHVGLSAIPDSPTNYLNQSQLLPPPTNKLALIGIWTAHWKKERRALIRMTYLRHRPESIDYYFFICSPIAASDQLWIAFENKHYQDIVVMKCIDNSHQGKIWNFIQSVRAICERTAGNNTNFSSHNNHNISLLIEDFPHLSDPPPSYDFIVKADDDSYIHMSNFAPSLLSLNKTSTYYGRFWYRNTDVPFACGMLWTLSYDLLAYLAITIHNDSRIIYGPEDYLIALWLIKLPVNIVDDPRKFIDHFHADSPIRGKQDNDTICIHQLKYDVHFMEIAMYYEQ